jgi:trk system potassium uptake protein TrkH
MSILMVLGFLGLLITQILGVIKFSETYEILLKCYLLISIWHQFIALSQRLAQYNTSPARFIVITFGTAILIGSGLLLLPKATTIPFHPIDALFTSTSAICVTGLIVVDTATAFTKTGQLIILGLIQLGGLGIMTVTAFFSLLIGQRMSGREQVLLGNMLSTDRPDQLGAILRAVFFTTISIEACGALLLFSHWRHVFEPGFAWYTSIFHAISAFCNAGFSTFSTSLMNFAPDTAINLTICGLIILGGLGFRTLRDLKSLFSKGTFRQKFGRVSVQSKVILTVTGILLGIGMLLFFLIESSHLLQGASLKDRALASIFQSVTCRTAGFNTVNIADLHPASLMLSIILMFIGAAPGSTGGGLKVTTVAILIGTVIASARGRSRLDFFRRTIPVKVLYQTLVVITIYLSVAVVVSFLLSITEQHSAPLELIFETISALGTVGLSTGVTPQLSLGGKVLVIITMFLGRIGPFTLALAIGQRQFRESYNYPEEEVQIG